MNLRCLFGHKWIYHGPDCRECKLCHRQHRYMLINMGMAKAWVWAR